MKFRAGFLLVFLILFNSIYGAAVSVTDVCYSARVGITFTQAEVPGMGITAVALSPALIEGVPSGMYYGLPVALFEMGHERNPQAGVEYESGIASLCPGNYYIYIGQFEFTDRSSRVLLGPNPQPIGQVNIASKEGSLEIIKSGTIWEEGEKFDLKAQAAPCISQFITSWKFTQKNKIETAYGTEPEVYLAGFETGPMEIELKIMSNVSANAQCSVMTKKTTVTLIKKSAKKPREYDVCLTAGNPIAIKDGAKYQISRDISLKNPGFDLDYTRYYHSTLAQDVIAGRESAGGNGTGWMSNYDYKLTETPPDFYSEYSPHGGLKVSINSSNSSPDGNISVGTLVPGGFESAGIYQEAKPVKLLTLLLPGGGEYVFKCEGVRGETGLYTFDETYTLPDSDWVVRKDNGAYILEMEFKAYRFDVSGRLLSVKDKAGKGIDISYGQNSTTVTDSYGRDMVITKNADGTVASVSAAGETCNYTYTDMAGRKMLDTVRRPSGLNADYDYETAGAAWGLLTRRKDNAEQMQNMRFFVQDVAGRGLRYTEEWDSQDNLLVKLVFNQDKSTTVTDEKGTRTYYFGTQGRLTSVNWSNGTDTREYFPATGLLKKKTEKNGTSEEYLYDENHRLVSVVTTWQDNGGGGTRVKTESYQYYPDGRVKKYTDARGVETEYDYNSQGLVRNIVHDGKETAYEYYSNGSVKTVRDAEQMSKTYTYDSYGNVLAVRNNATAGVETYTYYNNGITGRVHTHTDVNGTVRTYAYHITLKDRADTIIESGTGGTEVTTYTYYEDVDFEKRGSIRTVSNNSGTVTYAYNNRGLLQTETHADGSGTDKVKTYQYDQYRRVRQAAGPGTIRRGYSYDHYGNIETVTDSNGAVTRYYYDVAGNRTTVIDRNGKTTSYIYDGLSRLRKTTDAEAGVTEYDYDASSNRTLIKDANNNSTIYEYDGFSRMTKELFADGSYVSYGYSPEGNLKSRVVYDKNSVISKTQLLTYDGGHRMTGDGIYSYGYLQSGCACSTRISQVTGPNGTRDFTYDFKSRITSDTTTDGAFGVTVSRVYNDTAREKTVKLGTTELFTIKTDGAGRAVKITEKLNEAENVYVISYDNSGRVWERVYPNKNRSVTEYDNEGRIKKHVNYLENRVISRYEHELDAEGNKKNEKNMVGTRNYSYDNTYQLTAAQYERGQAFTWDYDAAGNREYSNEQLTMNSEKVKNYSKNSLNQYTAVNSRSYSYDADGNLLSDGTRIFTWDKKNRMTTVTMGTTTVSYVYDHNDLRVKKTVTKGGVSKVTRYIYDGSLLLAEYEDDVLVKVYINDGEGIVGMVRYLYNEGAFSHYQRLYYLYDTLGSVAQVTAENGLAVQEYLYTPYGEAYNTAADSVNGLRFVGRYGGYTDDDVKLTYFWHRWYDSADGRWVSRDPIGVAGGVNLYGYVGNRAVNGIDTTGLITDPGPQERPVVTAPYQPAQPPKPSKTNCYRPNCREQYMDCLNRACDTQGTIGNICTAIAVGCAIGCPILCKGIPQCLKMCATACIFASGGCEIINYSNFAGNLLTCDEERKKCK